ncbi:DUF6443 domain-containing protein [Pleurocapsa sp. PCC 7319]|uniref:DUF6443 domain-containing protein n=1 Tax=Pleurocapsa sp. PCC 7319 TaxID=118161 RepID=UPI00034A1E5A|nr:DUF6443 domain-containing protein [Pleurocapsa sp. PCC 7319]
MKLYGVIFGYLFVYSNPTNKFVYEYKYEKAKTDRNRGWLGFEKNILSWEKYDYDERMNLASRSQYWDRNEGKWLTSSTTYDTYGNVVSISDPLGNTSTTSYEEKYHTFPQTSTTPDPDPNNPSDSPLTVTTTYEPKFGIKTQVIDPNGHKPMEILDSDIDGFGRILEVKGIKPDSEAMVTVGKTEFNPEANGLSVKTWYRTRWEGDDVPNDETWLWEQEYIDGLGRTYQSESKGYNSQTKLIDKVQFNARGQVEKSYLPYYSDADPNNDRDYTSYQYDIRGQVTQTTQPNGTVTKTDYSKQYSSRQLTYQLPDPTEGMEGVNFVNAIVQANPRSWTTRKIAPDNSVASYEYDLLG